MLTATNHSGLGRRPITVGGNDHLTRLIVPPGANGSTTFLDVSNGGKFGQRHTVTPEGNAVHSSAVVMGGANSIRFDGSGDAIDFGQHADWHLADHDFTIEFYMNSSWIAPSGVSGPSIFGSQDASGASGWMFWQENVNGAYSGVVYFEMGTGVAQTGVYTAQAMSTGVTYHIAAERHRDTLTMYLNGTPKHQIVLPAGMKSPAPPSSLKFGRCLTPRPGHTADFNGYGGGIRVNKGIARYRGAFTPPSIPYKSWE